MMEILAGDLMTSPGKNGTPIIEARPTPWLTR
jgi:hypothetical protein